MTARAATDHPQRQQQEHRLTDLGQDVVGAGEREDSLVTVWGNSWHQQPTPMSLTGGPGTDGTFELRGEYGGGWAWRIVFDTADAERRRMRMDNVIPAGQATVEMPAGPYPVMVAEVIRA
ncbi:hypothetical protein Nm8I071_60930 [Nonomuraea sp. TT08I-71]|nr:hypothetical protein Nm8I071_60930 [Nonomuraea sp. TT08I-71]